MTLHQVMVSRSQRTGRKKIKYQSGHGTGHHNCSAAPPLQLPVSSQLHGRDRDIWKRGNHPQQPTAAKATEEAAVEEVYSADEHMNGDRTHHSPSSRVNYVLVEQTAAASSSSSVATRACRSYPRQSPPRTIITAAPEVTPWMATKFQQQQQCYWRRRAPPVGHLINHGQSQAYYNNTRTTTQDLHKRGIPVAMCRSVYLVTAEAVAAGWDSHSNNYYPMSTAVTFAINLLPLATTGLSSGTLYCVVCYYLKQSSSSHVEKDYCYSNQVE